ncbi:MULTISPECIES: hypothetical protein [Chromobacterium]|uniref:Holin n=1 Tax=Chromobacterium phragmitis TaxID=2202141 RepID=A0ABV0J0G8_9NEIS|nr:hypothetical protein [Chromobacterium sp. ASV23]
MIDTFLHLLRGLREIDAAEAFNKVARPYVTVMVVTVFNAVCVWGVVQGRMTMNDFVQTIGPTNGLIVGFWFGERRSRPDQPQGNKE